MAAKDIVLREFPPVGRHRILVLETAKRAQRIVDLREFVSGSSFEGFTRRGIMIADRAQAELLRDILTEILDTSLLG